jgi:squalene-hopene/tetraprenyl-beta-curcumene cyclase
MKKKSGTRNAQWSATIQNASTYLLAQAGQELADLRHVMNFGHAAGFTGTNERQSGDMFARATLANLFLDIAESVPTTELAEALGSIARREAEYVARAKVLTRGGGWSYFPDLPELPPDADSLAAVVSLFARVAPEYLELCREPVDVVLSGANPDGSFETWIVAPTDMPSDRERMRWGIQNCWGSGADPDVMSHFYHSLWLLDRERYFDAIRKGASTLMDMQRTDGTWRATWYVGDAYGTSLAVRLLAEIGMGESARQHAHTSLLDRQEEDGTWGDGPAASLQTALSLIALRYAEPGFISNALERGAAALQERQLTDGSWNASPWIQMEIGRATGKTLCVATYQSVTLTTAFCLRALLWTDGHPKDGGGVA